MKMYGMYYVDLKRNWDFVLCSNDVNKLIDHLDYQNKYEATPLLFVNKDDNIKLYKELWYGIDTFFVIQQITYLE